MLSQLLKQMDAQLSNKPFKHRWWTRPWICHMRMHPPISKDYPLWKRNKDELRLLRLFDLSPEELGLKIKRYWKKPWWRRWLSSFGMKKKIDVWNYYHCCLAYQAVRPDKLFEQAGVVGNKNSLLLNELGLVLHHFNAKFETYLERSCRNPKWIDQHFLQEIKAYKKKLKKIFLTKLNKSLKKIETAGDRYALKQQAEQEYQQVEALMLRYYRQRANNFFSRSSQANLVPEVGIDVVQEENLANSDRSLAIYNNSQNLSFSSEPTLPSEDHQTGINSLHSATEWIKTQRQRLNSLIEEGSLQKVEALLQTSFNEIKTIIELHLENCEKVFSDIQGKPEAHDALLKYLDNAQRRLKPLLQGGMLLFHPDHVMNLTLTQALWNLLNRFSQSHLEQSRYYLDRIRNYYVRIKAHYPLTEQSFEERTYIERCIQELAQSIKELRQFYKELHKRIDEFEAQRMQDKIEMEVKLKASEAQRVQDKVEMEEKINRIMKLFEAQQPARISTASNDKIEESSSLRFFKP